jgi:threonine 3-dehydrogenase
MPMIAPGSMRVPRFLGGQKIEFGEKPIPRPGPGQLLIKIKANALCGSERPQFFEGTSVTPGHEAAGVVAEVGPGTGTPVGTPGAIYLMDYCGTCRSCRVGCTNQCLSKRGDMGFNRDGGYGAFELIHENIFFPVDGGLDLAHATMLLDVMGTNAHAIERCRLVRSDIQSLLVMGAGPVGLGLVAMAKIVLGRDLPVLAADIAPFRLKLAERLGALPIDLAAGPLDEGLKRHGQFPVDIAVDASGKGAARRAAMNALGQRGALICVGHGEGIILDVSPDLIAPERSVMGSEYFRYDEMAANMLRLREHRPYLAQIVTHRFGLSEIEQAFRLFYQGETGKVVIEQ